LILSAHVGLRLSSIGLDAEGIRFEHVEQGREELDFLAQDLNGFCSIDCQGKLQELI